MRSAPISRLIRTLEAAWPEARCSLDFETPWQLLAATILSAQCTDARVNRVTPELFRKFPTPDAMAGASLREIEKLIHSTGFFKHKAQALRESARVIVEEHGGRVPERLEDLVKLRGVGRKTANVVLGNAFGIPGIVVDTHVGRLSRRLGLSRHSDPEKVEQDLMRLVPRDRWSLFSHWLVFHGRKYCMSRKPDCAHCPLMKFCPRVGVDRSHP